MKLAQKPTVENGLMAVAAVEEDPAAAVAAVKTTDADIKHIFLSRFEFSFISAFLLISF